MTQGEKLTAALDWFERALTQETKENVSMMNRCLKKAVQLEAEGLAAGESYD